MTKTKPDSASQQKGFAKAFKIDIGREKDIIEEKWEVTGGRSLLMNPVRQNIFKYLCEYPCSSLSTIAHDFEISVATMSWHIKLLLKRKLISEYKSGGQRLLFPQNMIDNNVIPILSLLTKSKIQIIFTKIRNTPGITQKELGESLKFSHQSINNYTSRLQSEDLINIVHDGKFTRYYPTNRLVELELSQRKQLKEFRSWIIKAFKYDGVNPKLIRVTDRVLFIQITSGSKIESMKLSVNPFYSTIQDKEKFLAQL